MDFTLLSHQIAPLQDSAAISPLLQSPNKGIFCIKVIYFDKIVANYMTIITKMFLHS